MGYWNPSCAGECWGRGFFQGSVSKKSYVSVGSWLPLKESVTPRRWLGKARAFLGRVPEGRQLAPSASEPGLFLKWQQGQEELCCTQRVSFCPSCPWVRLTCPRETPSLFPQCWYRLGPLPDSILQLPFISQLSLIMSPSIFFFKLHANRSCVTPVFSFFIPSVTVIQNTHRTNGDLTFSLTKQGCEGDSLEKYLFLWRKKYFH